MKSQIHEHRKNNFRIVSKKLIIAALLVISSSGFAQNQTPPEKKSDKPRKEKQSPEQRGQKQLEKWTAELKLDAKQQEQIKPILEEQIAKNQAMKAELMENKDKLKDLTPEEREIFKHKRKEEKVAIENKLKAILSPEQFKKMKEMEAANKEANREKMREFREARQDASPEE